MSAVIAVARVVQGAGIETEAATKFIAYKVLNGICCNV
jgi:hypothetical protein